MLKWWWVFFNKKNKIQIVSLLACSLVLKDGHCKAERTQEVNLERVKTPNVMSVSRFHEDSVHVNSFVLYAHFKALSTKGVAKLSMQCAVFL